MKGASRSERGKRIWTTLNEIWTLCVVQLLEDDGKKLQSMPY
jgi:hypothetical protein